MGALSAHVILWQSGSFAGVHKLGQHWSPPMHAVVSAHEQLLFVHKAILQFCSAQSEAIVQVFCWIGMQQTCGEHCAAPPESVCSAGRQVARQFPEISSHAVLWHAPQSCGQLRQVSSASQPLVPQPEAAIFVPLKQAMPLLSADTPVQMFPFHSHVPPAHPCAGDFVVQSFCDMPAQREFKIDCCVFAVAGVLAPIIKKIARVAIRTMPPAIGRYFSASCALLSFIYRNPLFLLFIIFLCMQFHILACVTRLFNAERHFIPG